MFILDCQDNPVNLDALLTVVPDYEAGAVYAIPIHSAFKPDGTMLRIVLYRADLEITDKKTRDEVISQYMSYVTEILLEEGDYDDDTPTELQGENEPGLRAARQSRRLHRIICTASQGSARPEHAESAH